MIFKSGEYVSPIATSFAIFGINVPVPEVPEEDVSSLRKHATIGAMTKLSAGDHFPELMLNLAGGGGIQISQDLRSPFTILLFYRGFW